MKPLTDKQRIRSMACALRHAKDALRPVTRGSHWINDRDVARATRAFDRIEETINKCKDSPKKDTR